MTIRGHDADANAKFRQKRNNARADGRSVPGGHKVKGLCRKGKTERAHAGRGERKLLRAWDNVGGTGDTVEWKDGRTQIRKMAPSGDKPITEIFPERVRKIAITTVVKGKVKVTWVHVHTTETVDGPCNTLDQVRAGDARPERWSEHGKHVNGGWQAGARFNTEKLAFSWDVDRGKD